MRLGRAIGGFAGDLRLRLRAFAGKPSAPVSLSSLLPRIAADQKKIWVSPWTSGNLSRRRALFGVAGTIAGLIALDPLDNFRLRQTAGPQSAGMQRVNNILSGTNTGIAIGVVPVFFYVLALVRRDRYAADTALLAAEALANAEIVQMVLKNLDFRMRPGEVGAAGRSSDTWFRTANRGIGGAGCFPSGHTTSSFAMATVFAERSRGGWTTPVVAYGAAAAVAGSRLSSRAHFPSDVLFGALFGHSISRFVVLGRGRDLNSALAGPRERFPDGTPGAGTD